MAEVPTGDDAMADLGRPPLRGLLEWGLHGWMCQRGSQGHFSDALSQGRSSTVRQARPCGKVVVERPRPWQSWLCCLLAL